MADKPFSLDEMEAIGNGHATAEDVNNTVEAEYKGGRADLDKLSKPGAIAEMSAPAMGVLQGLAHAVIKDTDYRQALYFANFANREEARRASNAINFCKRYGASISAIIDDVIAQCAEHGRRVEDIKAALTHYQVTTNQVNNKHENRLLK